jgi:Domain of unknown function (DUF1844)
VSTLWTPGGEHRVPRSPADEEAGQAGNQQGGGPGSRGGAAPGQPDGSSAAQGPETDSELTPEEAREAKAELDAMREQLARAPAELVIANHAMGLWELAALHLSQTPPQLPQAKLAIDGLTALLDGLRGRLGDDEKSLRDGLAEIQMAFVQIHNSERARQGSATTA